MAITQGEHGALAGRLARAWDDDLPASLLVATAEHELGWEAWDAAPTLDPERGVPRSFRRMTTPEYAGVWRDAVTLAPGLGPEAELWVLRHGLRIFGWRADDPGLYEVKAAMTERADALLARLREDPAHAVDDQALARGSSLLALFDELSLVVAHGVTEPTGAGVLTLAPAGPERIAVTPWPFVGVELDVTVPARVLPRPLADQAALDAAWAAASVQDLRVLLVRG